MLVDIGLVLDVKTVNTHEPPEDVASMTFPNHFAAPCPCLQRGKRCLFGAGDAKNPQVFVGQTPPP